MRAGTGPWRRGKCRRKALIRYGERPRRKRGSAGFGGRRNGARVPLVHTDGHTDGDATLQACWDADRLDLGRVRITPQPHRLCTDAARELIAWADWRATQGHEPEAVLTTWGL